MQATAFVFIFTQLLFWLQGNFTSFRNGKLFDVYFHIRSSHTQTHAPTLDFSILTLCFFLLQRSVFTKQISFFPWPNITTGHGLFSQIWISMVNKVGCSRFYEFSSAPNEEKLETVLYCTLSGSARNSKRFWTHTQHFFGVLVSGTHTHNIGWCCLFIRCLFMNNFMNNKSAWKKYKTKTCIEKLLKLFDERQRKKNNNNNTHFEQLAGRKNRHCS